MSRNGQLYAIFDNKSNHIAGQFVHIFMHPAAAIRMFGDVLSSTDTIMGRHPEDYELIELAAMNDDPRTLTACEPTTILTGAQWKALQEKEA